MTEAELRSLVREAIIEAILPPPRRALVVFTGGLLGFEDAVASLRRLAATGVQLDYLQTPSAERILDQDLIASLGMRRVSDHIVESHDLLIAPTLTSNIAAKAAHGVADCLASNLFSEFIMTNRLVVASSTAVCPDGAAKRAWFPQMPPAYADLLRANLNTLAAFGVRLSDARCLCRTALAAWERRDAAQRAPIVAALGTSVAGFAAGLAGRAGRVATRPKAPAAPASVLPCAGTLISQQVIQQTPVGAELRIGSHALVTAAARDAAAARSIRISREV